MIEIIKTMSMENVGTGVLEIIKNNIQEVQIKPKKDHDKDEYDVRIKLNE